MMQLPTIGIPEQLEFELIERAGGGASPESIAAWLSNEHGVRVLPSTVATYLRDVHVLFDKVRASDYVNADLDGLTSIIARVEEIRADARTRGIQALETFAMRLEFDARAARIRLAVDVGVPMSEEDKARAAQVVKLHGPK